MFMNLSADFIRTIQNTFGDKGSSWLASLPDLIDEASRRWCLTNIQPVPNLSYNFVAFAARGQENVVLKIGVLNRELTSEMSALRFFDGKGAVRLQEADEERGMFLLERLQPGNMLTTLNDDDQAMHIAAEVMLNTLATRANGRRVPSTVGLVQSLWRNCITVSRAQPVRLKRLWSRERNIPWPTSSAKITRRCSFTATCITTIFSHREIAAPLSQLTPKV